MTKKSPIEKVLAALTKGRRVTSKKMKSMGVANPGAHMSYLRNHRGYRIVNEDGAYVLK